MEAVWFALGFLSAFIAEIVACIVYALVTQNKDGENDERH